MVGKITICAVMMMAPLSVGSAALAADPTPATTVAPNAADSSLVAGEVLGVDQAVRSPNGRYTLVQQPDGNLVLYNPARKGIYSTNTAGNPGAKAVMQPDGNLVIYSTADKPIFRSDTANHPGARLDVQDDGNVVIYDKHRVLWHTATTGR